MSGKNPHESLYYDKEVSAVSPSGKRYEMSIQTRDMMGVPDCMIGHFGYNFWFRTRRAMQTKPYDSTMQLEKAVKLSLIKRGWKDVKFI